MGDEATLRKDFSECGSIADLLLLTDKETGRNRGMAFITFADLKGFEKALKYDGDDYGGRTLKVCKAEARTAAQERRRAKPERAAQERAAKASKAAKAKAADNVVEYVLWTAHE